MSVSQRIVMHLKSYDPRSLDVAAKDIIDTARRTGAEACGPVPLPVRIRKYTVLRSPHINKKARDQFEMRTHKRLISLLISPQSNTLDALMKVNLKTDVEVEIKV